MVTYLSTDEGQSKTKAGAGNKNLKPLQLVEKNNCLSIALQAIFNAILHPRTL